MIKQLRIFEIIIICILVKSLYGKSINERPQQTNRQKDARVKRGHSSYGGNDFGSSVLVSSGVLQYSGADEHSLSSNSDINVEHSSNLNSGLDFSSISADHFGSLGSGTHLESSASSTDPWSASGVSSGYDVWLEPLVDSHATLALDAQQPVGNHIVNTVFSDGSEHSAHLELPNSQLHTKISSSSIHGHDISAISDNIDFHNVADLNTQHYTKSYGK